jgi:sugar lactone lactonase YvrE
MVAFGDAVSRRFLKYSSTPHRLASAVLVGLVLSSWITYLGARAFANSSRPLMAGNLLFFIIAGGIIFLLRRKGTRIDKSSASESESLWDKRLDWATVAVFFVIAWWMMFSSFNMQAGKLQIANHQWSDFGPNVAIMQSFALGRNFPTEYPHFAGDRIRYHFLFYFQAGNLEYLGLNPAWANNLLSVLSLVSMLSMVMALGYSIFRSRAIGRIGAALFFFHGSLAYVSFLRSQESIGNAFKAATSLNSFLPSGFPYRGEDWGMWSLVNFLNQRHFASAIGILLIVLVFLIDRYRAAAEQTSETEGKQTLLAHLKETLSNIKQEPFQWLKQELRGTSSFLFVGGLLGLLPMWNGAVFVAAFAVLSVLLILFPFRVQLVTLMLVAVLIAIPQLLYLTSGNVHRASYSLFHWGYTIDNPTIKRVLTYLGFTFGFKWFFIALAVVWMSWFQRRLIIAVTSLVAVAFLFQFSEEVLVNHKFLNVWLILANLFVAYGIVRLWTMRIRGTALAGKVATLVLLVLVTLGGAIDLVPIHRAYWAEVQFDGDPLIRWAKEQTDPKAVFLSDRFVMHQILLAGRRVFFGWPYYSWGAGYQTGEREAIYKRLFQERNASALQRLLTENKISYVAIDDGLRHGDFIQNINEAVYESHFEKVFQDTENRYGGIAIFKVPTSLPSTDASIADSSIGDPNIPAVNAFEGGRGTARGQFASARGVATDLDGNIYVADTGNSRIQKFSPQGEFMMSIGRSGNGLGQLREPSGVAIDGAANIYVTDSVSHKLVKFKSDGSFVAQWGGPGPGFYGPRDVAVGPQGYLYVVDQGRTRIVVLDTAGNTIAEWGKKGKAPGEFDDPTGVAVGGDRVYVADLRNSRIQVFNLDGQFLREWQVPEWREQVYHNPDVIFDPQLRRVYASSGATNEVLVFDADGKRLGPKVPAKPAKLDRPSGLALADAGVSKHLCVMNTDGARLSLIDLSKSEANK